MTDNLFDITGHVAVVTGGYGVLGGSIADALAAAGAHVAVLGRSADAAEAKTSDLRASTVRCTRPRRRCPPRGPATKQHVIIRAAYIQSRSRIFPNYKRRTNLMKLGLGLYRSLLTEDNFRFAKQAGVTHLVVHLVDYFKGKSPTLTSGPNGMGWGYTDAHEELWSYEELATIKKTIEANGLTWEAIENFDPAHWHDILLDGPNKRRQLENLKQMIRDIGRVGVPIVGYNFSLAGVWGWTRGPFGRGDAVSVRYDESAIDPDTPIPNGMVWNMIYDQDACPGTVAPVSQEELWQRYEDFLSEIIPVAEESGVKMALHPDDPPAESLRGTARLVNHPDKYERVLDLVPSESNALEFCLGSLQEMRDGDVYESIAHYGRQGKIAYVHFRNVRGKVPFYQEVFVDEGDLDMLKVVRTLSATGYDGVLIPDHTPEMTCDAPWHAGMAYALGYMKAAIQCAG